MTWYYDGSFDGLLCAVATSYAQKSIPDTLQVEPDSGSLFDAPQEIETDGVQARRVAAAIQKHFDPRTRRRLMHAFLCDDSAPERDLLLYIRLGFKSPALLEQLSHPVVYAVEGYEKRVMTTRHKMLAFTRFEELGDGTLYARIEPPRNVLPLLGSHFAARLGGTPFIIHDLGRQTALLHRDGQTEFRQVHAAKTPQRSADEAHFQQLWRTFFDRVAIASRHNPALQRQFVPLHYRRWMTEFSSQE